ncbi:MAG: hypothetical protein ABGX22_23270, partial [Pirellulaceae bacterium]
MESLSPLTTPRERIGSIDAYRGLVMFLMMAEVLHLAQVARAFPESGVWQFLGYHQSHVPWLGCSLHDLIQPSFSFLVGVALPFSIASRMARGQSTQTMFGQAVTLGDPVLIPYPKISGPGLQTNAECPNTNAFTVSWWWRP